MASYLRDGEFCDVCIAGAGIIGLSLALELRSRGLRVTVLDAGRPLAQASTAAAGMLAAEDPENPPLLAPLSALSLALYPDFLARIEQLSGVTVPLQTSRTLQSLPAGHTITHPLLSSSELAAIVPALTTGTHHFFSLAERSLDPRQLATALLEAARAAGITLHANRPSLGVEAASEAVAISTPTGPIQAEQYVDCTGAWAGSPISPKKGQLLYLQPPLGLDLNLVLRTAEFYILPRTNGPNAGRLLVGATVEDAGFDTATHASDLAALRAQAAALLPPLAAAPMLESWAGLRPATPDGLPLLGQIAPRRFLAAGHYRNGILLAPGTAHVLAQLLTGETPAIDLAPHAPYRFR